MRRWSCCLIRWRYDFRKQLEVGVVACWPQCGHAALISTFLLDTGVFATWPTPLTHQWPDPIGLPHVWQFKKNSKVSDLHLTTSWNPRPRSGFGNETFPFTSRACDSYGNKFGDYVEGQGNDVQTQSCAVLFSIYLRYSKTRLTSFISSSVLFYTSGPRYEVKSRTRRTSVKSLPALGLRHCLAVIFSFSFSQLTFQRCC